MGQSFHCLHLPPLLTCLLLAFLPTPSTAMELVHPRMEAAICRSSTTPIAGPGASRERRASVEVRKVKRLAKSLIRVPSARRRSEILDQMIELARGDPAAAAEVQRALEEIRDLAYRRANRRVFTRPFDHLERAANELAGLRSNLLAIVRDETRYPYPCAGPGATADAVHRYRQTQPEVDAAYSAIRSAIETQPPVEMPELLAKHLALIHWTHGARAKACAELELTFEFTAPEGPSWLLGLPFDAETIRDGIALDEFGRSVDEGQRQARSRAVMARNQELHKQTKKKVRGAAAKKRLDSEFEQVRLTNEYRTLLGLNALHWDPRLHEAARLQAEFITAAGEVVHEQPSAALRTPSDRAKSCGYPTDAYENVHMGSKEASGAFDAWFRSSGHHRALLLEHVTEMATARADEAWTQLFGTGSAGNDSLSGASAGHRAGDAKKD